MILEQFQSVGHDLFSQGLVSSNSGNLSIRLGDNTIITSGALNPSTKPFPTVQELVKSVGSIPLKELDKHAKTNGFVTGVVGKIFSSKYGGGVEICNPLDIDSVPITVYVEEGTSAVEGQELIVYGYINQKATGDITINAGGVF